MDKEIEVFSKYIRDKNLKFTQQREEVLKTFLKAERHFTTEELYTLVKKKNSKIGYATVYRTLKLIDKSGLAREVDFGDGILRFEHKFGHNHHDHLVCVKCGRYIEVINSEIEKLQDELSKKHKFTPLRHKMQIFGICHRCKKK